MLLMAVKSASQAGLHLDSRESSAARTTTEPAVISNVVVPARVGPGSDRPPLFIFDRRLSTASVSSDQEVDTSTIGRLSSPPPTASFAPCPLPSFSDALLKRSEKIRSKSPGRQAYTRIMSRELKIKGLAMPTGADGPATKTEP
ncbi:hypothetical protein RvY_02458 [Ramazzottius varieornatus]|uniref:Uncharacterized protein n=1 Tax=Ramazzottius varieornatus TaxID=947166 RepID=A0A1D1UJS0_RAMVA|nr:hypothetical protein RvY_02458 [Ramazzottius varieornatus]